MRTHKLALAVLAVAFAACTKDAITLVPATVRQADGKPIGDIAAFTKIRVKHTLFSDPDWLTVVDGEKVGDVRASTLAILPIKTEARWLTPVVVEVKGALEEPSPVVRKYPGGTKVDVALIKPDKDDLAVVVERGAPVGYVRPADLADKQPAAAEYWKQCESALRDMSSEHAVEAAEAVLVADEKNAPALEALGALLASSDVVRSKELFTKLGAQKPLPDVVSGAEVAAGDGAYVAAASAVLHDAADDKAPTVQTLEIDTAVSVVEVKGAFAKVRLVSGTLAVDVKDGVMNQEHPGIAPDVFSSVTASVTAAGWVRTHALAKERPSADALLARAQKTKSADEALVLSERALALTPWDASLRRAVVDAALKAGRFGEAGRLVREYDPHASEDSVHAVVDVFHGCHGEVTHAHISKGETMAAGTIVDDACAEYDPEPPCPAQGDGCIYNDGGRDDGAIDPAEDKRTPEVKAAEEAAAAAARAAEDAQRAAQDAQENAAHVAQVAEKEKQTAIVDAIFPRGPVVRVTLSKLARLAAGRKVYLYEQTMKHTPCEGDTFEKARYVEVPLPQPTPHGDVVLWLDASRGLHYGAFTAFPADVASDAEGENGLPPNAISLAEASVPTLEGDCRPAECCGD